MKLTMKKTPLLLALMAATTSWSSNLLAHGDSHQGLEEEWYMNVESDEDLEAQDAEDQHHAHGDMPMTAPAMNHSGMDHSQMNHEGMNHGDMPMITPAMDHSGMDHSQMNHEVMNHGDMPMAAPAMDHSGMNHSGMDHSTMNHGEMNHGTMPMTAPAMDHSGMDHSQMSHEGMNHGDMPMAAPAMDHSGIDHSQMQHGAMGPEGMGHAGMNHGEMNHDMSGMQGGSAPANARDPHAYSGGYTLTSGPYAMEGSRQLVLADEHWFSSLSLEQLGISRSRDETSKVAEGEYWIGTTWDRLALSFDIDHLNGETEAELGGYWRHAITAFWNTQLGVKHERGEGDSRNWIGLGFQGLAPYWFESEAMLYVGKQGVTSLELSAEYEILLTQRWIIAVEADANLAGKDDPEGEFASGLVSTSVAPRLRYEISRQFAPYVGVQRSHWYGDSADLQESPAETAWQAGVRVWF